MKKHMLVPAALFALTFLTLFVFGAESSAVSEEARTLQMIAPYRTWGKANVQTIALPADQVAIAG